MSPSSQPDRRLADILQAIERIERYVDAIGGDPADLQNSSLHSDAVERNLLIISEAAAKLRGQIDDLSPEIDWRAIRGMGNILRHDYDGISSEVIVRVVSEKLPELKSVCRRLLGG